MYDSGVADKCVGMAEAIMEISNQNLKDDIEDSNKDLSSKIEEIYVHTKVMNRELGETRDEVASIRSILTEHKIAFTELKVDVDWIKRFMWVVLTASIGTFIAIVINFFVR